MRRTAMTIFCVLWIGLFGAVSAQMPEVIVQYAQRLGGAHDEVESFLLKFDEGASRSGLTREAAIQKMLGNPETLYREQGLLMQSQVQRLGRLAKQKVDLGNGLTVGGVYSFATGYDPALLERTLKSFSPALPLSFLGALFAVMGGIVGIALLLLGACLLRVGRRVEA